MAAWTLVQAQEHLAAWLAAETACAAGQSYQIGSRSLTRANLPFIAERISFWRRQVEQLEAGRTGAIRLLRVVPRDL